MDFLDLRHKKGKSWIMSGLKSKWDASGGKTIHEGTLVLVEFMWSLSVLTRLFSLFSLWSDWLSFSAMFSKNDEDSLEVYHLMYVTKLSCTCRKRIKWKKRKETKQNKTNERKVR
jgi:hypothetical protein